MKITESYKAWRRGEKRIKGVYRGRCFEKKEKGGGSNATASPVATLEQIKIIRANGTEEIING